MLLWMGSMLHIKNRGHKDSCADMLSGIAKENDRGVYTVSVTARQPLLDRHTALARQEQGHPARASSRALASGTSAVSLSLQHTHPYTRASRSETALSRGLPPARQAGSCPAHAVRSGACCGACGTFRVVRRLHRPLHSSAGAGVAGHDPELGGQRCRQAEMRGDGTWG
jgi:hypothetical protein